jgi:DNA-binding Xre family transcriptional regulator
MFKTHKIDINDMCVIKKSKTNKINKWKKIDMQVLKSLCEPMVFQSQVDDIGHLMEKFNMC